MTRFVAVQDFAVPESQDDPLRPVVLLVLNDEFVVGHQLAVNVDGRVEAVKVFFEFDEEEFGAPLKSGDALVDGGWWSLVI